MSRRIDIELTSDRGDGTWTWRAAGAKQPKGVVAGDVLPGDAAVGQELRADVETTLDGSEVLSVAPPKAKNRAAVETIEILPQGGDEPLVTQTLARGGKGRRDRDDSDRGDRRGRGGGRGDGPRGDRPRGDRPQGDGPRGDGDRNRGPRRERPERDRSHGRDDDRGNRGARRERPAPPSRPKAKRLRPGRAHRKVAVAALTPDERVLADFLLQGGVPAVRQAIQKQNEQARAEGTRLVAAAPVLVVAEQIHPPLRIADWRDRAEAAISDLEELDLRDLRSVVVAAESGAKDEETLVMASELREGLARRLDAEHAAWLQELSETLQEGRAVRALRLSSRPPKAGAPLPAEITKGLVDAATTSLTSDTMDDRWATVLDALSLAPVRLSVGPQSRPDEPSPALVATVTRFADRVPKVAEAFGIEAPAPRRGRGGQRKPQRTRKKPAKAAQQTVPTSAAPGAPKPPPPPPPPPPVAEPQAPSETKPD